MKRVRKAKSRIFDITETQEEIQAISERLPPKNVTVIPDTLVNEVTALRTEVKQINQTQAKLAEAVSNLAIQVTERQNSTDVQVSQQVDLSEPMEALLSQLVEELRHIQEDVHTLSSAQTQTELALSDVQLNTTGEVHALRSELSTVLENFFQKALKEGTELRSRTEQEHKPLEAESPPLVSPRSKSTEKYGDDVFSDDVLIEDEDLVQTD